MFWWTKVVVFLYCVQIVDVSCCSCCWLNLKHVLDFLFLFYSVSSFLIWRSTTQLVFFDLWFQCCACIAGLYFFRKAVLMIIIVRFTGVPAFATLCSVLLQHFVQPHFLCCLLCLAHIKMFVVASRKNILLQFQCEITTNLFFQHMAFWMIVLKMSILIFTCYMTCTYL